MAESDRRERLIAKFRRVSAERINAILSGVDGLEAKPQNDDLSNQVKRELHTLKGEAKMLRFEDAGHVTHHVEELLLKAMAAGRLAGARDDMIEGLDLVSELVSADAPYPAALTARVSKFLSRAPADEPAAQAAHKPASEQLAAAETTDRTDPPLRTQTSREDRRARLLGKLRDVTPERVSAILAIVNEPGELKDAAAETKEKIKREIHTIKGETRLMKLTLAGDVAARTEALIVEGFRAPLDADGVRTGVALIAELVAAEEPYGAHLSARAEAFKAEDHVTEVGGPPATPAEDAEEPPTSAHQRFSESPGKVVEASLRSDDTTDYIRVSTTHVKAMTNVAGELLVRHEQLERSLSDVERIALDVLAEVERSRGLSAAAPRAAGLAKVAAFGREILSTLARASEEQFQNALQLSTLQDEIREIRMVRVGDLFATHARSIRQLARDQGKLVRVVSEGEEVTVDKQVLDCLDEPMLHLCRNAVDHGLEPPEIRAVAGKSQRGEIRLTAREIGGHVQLTVADDGRGVDPEEIRAAAVRKGLIDDVQASRIKGDQAFELMFRPGFSTRQTVSDISGRGVGLDVVSSMLGELGGSVQVESAVGLGTRFVLRSPISTAFTRGLVVKAGDGLYAIPSTSITSVVPVAFNEVEANGEGRSIIIEEERVPLVSFSELLGSETRLTGSEGKAVLIEGQGRIALLVDEVIGEREAVRRNLNSFVSGVDLVSGTGMMEGRRLVMYVNLQELFRLAGTQVGWKSMPTRAEPKARARKSRVLVVDDSELTRDMLVSLLERLNFVVDEAVDGADALQMLERQKPDLVMTDLDMPVMDGFGLLGRIRESPALKDLPVIVFSTRDSDDVKRRAMKEGANAYLVKAAFRADELNRTLRHYIKAGAEDKQDV